MWPHTCCGFWVAALLMLSHSAMSLASAEMGSHLRVLSADAHSVVLELTVDDIRSETVAYDGQTYHRLTIPGMAYTDLPGAPQIPTRAALVGVTSTQDLVVTVVDAAYETQYGYRLLPALAPQADAFNTINAFYPGKPVAIGHTGYLREQAVVQVQFSPVQYNPVTGDVRLYRYIRARITWGSPLTTATPESRPILPAYDRILQGVLLNYDAVTRSTASGRPPQLSTAGVEHGTAGVFTPTLKIEVTEDGLYELTYHDITAAGFDLNRIDPRTIQVTHRGSEVAIEVQGENDGIFDPADSVLFYGRAISDVYTAKNVYWLTAGTADGRRIGRLGGALSGRAEVPRQFPATRRIEENTYYWQTIPNGQGQDHWFWDDKFNAPESRDYLLTLRNLAVTAQTATVRVRLKGRTDIPTLHPDHHTKLYLNGVEIDDQPRDGQRIFDHDVTVSHALLEEGVNIMTVEAVGDTGAVVDQFFVNWIEIDYWNTYAAENQALRFRAPRAGTFQFEISGFERGDVDVLDITNPADVVRLTQATAVNGNRDTVQFEHASQLETRYLVQAVLQRKQPAHLEIDTPSSWRSPSHGADYIIVTHKDFFASSLELADHRRALGLRTAVVEVQDIYDEFNHGIFHPQAIRDFLSYTYQNWRPPAPTYVLLVGDGTQDYKDNLRTGTVNFVPSQIIETDLLGETPSDNWFVLVRGDDILPDMLIGRLSVQSVSQAEAVVDKIIRYEQAPPDDTWNTQALLVADDDSLVFENISEQLAALFPLDYVTHRVYVGDYPPGNSATDILQSIHDGTILVNYTGHGIVSRWGQWNGSNSILRRSDVSGLQNMDKLPIVTVANCLNGFFAGRRTQVSIAEALLRLPGAGAVAVWAPTSLGYASGQRVLLREFYEAVFHGETQTLGEATTAAKISSAGQSRTWDELVETFVLFGDPAMRIGIPRR